MRRTAWSATYSESDPRLYLFDPRDKLLFEGQPTIEMAIYPDRYADGEEVTRGFDIPERTQALFAKLEEFIRAAYPQE